MLAFDRAVDAMGATVLNKYHHKFSPQGVTVLYALAESHISCHTSPEIGEVAIDCFTCGSMNPEKGMDVLVKHFNPIETRIRVISR
jgi:S-adenosylmethionine decarboxylase proenzyme